MLSRLALRQATIRMAAAKASARTSVPSVAAFHSSAARKEEENKPAADAVHPGLLSQYGLDDWKISAPIIGAISIPALSNGVRSVALVVLACCRMALSVPLHVLD